MNLPVSECAALRLRPADASSRARHIPYVLGLVFVVLAAGIITAGVFYYRYYEQHCRTEMETQIAAIAELKAAELADWRADRLGDGAVFFKNAAFSALVRRHFDDPEDVEAREQIRTWLSHVQAAHQYDRVFLLDAQYSKKMTVPEAPERETSYVPERTSAILRAGEMAFEDFHRNAQNQRIYLKVLVPILEGGSDSRLVAVVALRVDPETYLYPYIQHWPTPSPTAETLIVRRDGNDALFLNSLRFQKDAALNLRVSLEEGKDLPAAKAAMGQEGIVEGRDYRGVPVVAAVRAVPGSPWFLVARMDTSEVYAPVKERLWVMVALVGALLLAAGAAVGFVWRQQSVRFYRERSRAAEALRESEARLRTVVAAARDAIVMMGPQGEVTLWSPAAEAMFGWTADEAVGRHVHRLLVPPRFHDAYARGFSGFQATGRGPAVGKTLEMAALHKDGHELPVELALSSINVAGHWCAVGLIRDITERKRAAEALSFKTMLLEAQSETSPDGILAVDNEGRSILFNKRFGELWRIPRHILDARDDGQMLECILCQLKDPVGFGRKVAYLYEHKDEMSKDEIEFADGRCFDRCSSPLVGANGNYYGRIWYFRDITERKRLEHELRRLAVIAEQAAEGIALADLDGNLQFVNEAWARMHGYESGAELVGKHLRLFHTDEQFQAEVAPFNAAVKRQGHHTGEVGHVRKDGTTFPTQMMVTLLKDEQGEPYGLAGFAEDITERKHAEQERGKALHRQQGISLLQQSLLEPAPLEAKLKIITDSIVRLFDTDFCRIWVIRPGDLCERGCMHAEVHEGPHVCRHRDRCLWLLASSGRYTHTDGKGHRRVPFDCYKIGRVASGRDHKFLTNDVVNDHRVHNHEWARELGLVSFVGYQLRVPGAETMGVLALFAKHPISAEEDALLDGLSSAVAFVVQQAAAEEAIRQSKAEAEQANAAKSQFLANMSHEIRTPMTAILGFTEMLGHSIECCTTCPEHQACPTRAQNKESVQVIRRNGEHLLELIGDILDLSKVEAGRTEVERVPCSPVQIVEEAVSLMRARAIEKGLTLDARYEFPLPETILSDPVRVRQVLINLVGNAVKFCSHGGVEIVVRCITDVRAGRASMAFDVKDTGIGMTPEQIGRLFQPFAQADSSTTRQYGGTGLGLAISKRLAEVLGGDIHVVSRPGEGSTFTFTVEAALPGPVRMLNDLSEAAARPSHLSQLPPPAAVRLCGRVLLAEDGPDNQKLIAMILRQAGADVDLASSGRVAVERVLEAMAAGTPYDTILMDMQMPEMDGYEATSKLRESGYRGPVVALTAHAMAGDRQKCIDAGCDDYATKPVDRLGLLRMLARLMGCPPSEPGEPASATTASDEAISSAFRDDPDMVGVIAEFVGLLPERLAEMRQAAGAGLWDVLRRLAHQLKGAGGSYGYACLTEAARELESHANQADVEGAVLALNHLAHLCEKIQAGHSPDSVSQHPRTR